MQGLQRFKTDMLTAERRHLQLWKVTAHHEIPSQTFRRGNEPRPCAQMAMRTFPSPHGRGDAAESRRSEEHTSELQSLMRISYAVFCLKKKNKNESKRIHNHEQR